MLDFLLTLKFRNPVLFWFGAVNFFSALVFVLFSWDTQLVVNGANAWHKPIKFALSIGVYAWSMGWLLYHLEAQSTVDILSWLIVILLGFEIVYISIQAGRGMASHFNLSSPAYAALYNLMAAAATGVSLLTLYAAILFFRGDFSSLEPSYLWGIRLGMILFVVFSLEGFVMGSRLNHTIGGLDGGTSLPFLNWSLLHGDPRVPHFVGMHALQILPLFGWALGKQLKYLFVAAVIYALLAVYTLVLALNGRPLPFLNGSGH